ncbi:MAG: transposase [Limisphaerales bacterium]
MPAITKRDRPIRIEFVSNQSASPLGGLPAIEALAQQFGLWKKIKGATGLDPRTRKGRGYGPDLIISQLIYSFCTGGDSLADAEKLKSDPLAKRLAGVPTFADESTLGEWLRAQSPESVRAIGEITREFIFWVMQRARPGRWLHSGQREVFFDDTELEVSGKTFEAARLNYEGNLALSWQVIWVGPFLAAQSLGGHAEPSGQLVPLLESARPLWQGHSAYFYADSASSAVKYLQPINAEGWHWSVSYNKWTTALERQAQSWPEEQWTGTTMRAWKNGEKLLEQYTWIKHQPENASEPILFAAVRSKGEKELFWRYAFVACESGRKGSAQAVFERHRLKGHKEQLFSEVLTGLDLHHPPCAELIANQMYYAVAALAYNLLVALKLLHLPEERQQCRLKTLIREIMILPGRFVTHARRVVARIYVAPEWLDWWRVAYEQMNQRTAPSG